jgi:hypothetical protein
LNIRIIYIPDHFCLALFRICNLINEIRSNIDIPFIVAQRPPAASPAHRRPGRCGPVGDRRAGLMGSALCIATDTANPTLIAPASCLWPQGLKAPRLEGACPLNPSRPAAAFDAASTVIFTTGRQ